MVSAEEWVCGHVRPTGPAEVVRDRVWATTSRIPTADGIVWFKAAAASHRFEAELVAQLAGGWPDLLPRVLGYDSERGWLLLADAGTPFEQLGNPPELWLRLLPRYAELQREANVPSSVPDRTLSRWPELYDDLARSELPLGRAEIARLRRFAPQFSELCEELAGYGLRDAIQHDYLHHKNAFVDGERLGSWTGEMHHVRTRSFHSLSPSGSLKSTTAYGRTIHGSRSCARRTSNRGDTG